VAEWSALGTFLLVGYGGVPPGGETRAIRSLETQVAELQQRVDGLVMRVKDLEPLLMLKELQLPTLTPRPRYRQQVSARRPSAQVNPRNGIASAAAPSAGHAGSWRQPLRPAGR